MRPLAMRSLAMHSLASLALLLVAAAPALADDEGSEHTAVLVGAQADTLGVRVDFADKTGWTMTVRSKPGAPENIIALPELGTAHAHFTVYVASGRTRITFVETMMGTTADRATIAPTDTLARTFGPDGTRVATITYGKVFAAKEIAAFQRSVSHMFWVTSSTVTKAGLELAAGKRTIIVDAKTGLVR